MYSSNFNINKLPSSIRASITVISDTMQEKNGGHDLLDIFIIKKCTAPKSCNHY